ncbi:MAG: UbiA family prenyltransferase [Acidobacteriota bacterium]
MDALRLVHYWWPVVMAWSIVVVVHRTTGRAVSSAGLCILLLGALAAYSLDRLRDSGSSRQPKWLRAALLAALLGAGFGGVLLLPQLSTQKLIFLGVLSAITLLYPTAKRIPLVKAVLVPAVWTAAGIVLPSVGGGWPSLLTPIAPLLFLLLAAGCLLCDVKDFAADREAGVRSLPVQLGIVNTVSIAAALAGLSAVLAWHEHWPGLLAGGLCMVAIAPWRQLLATESVGPLAVDFILTLPGFLIAWRLV